MSYLPTRKVISQTRNKGFTLIEAMVSIVIGLVVLLGVMEIASNVILANSAVVRSVKLNQNLGAVMQVMVDDIRRAGYGVDYTSTPPGKVAFTEGEDINIVSASCILYSYNHNENNAIDNNERYGFKLENGQIRMRRSCDPAQFANCSTNCANGTGVNWEYLSDDDTNNVLTVTSLAFTTTGSKCRLMAPDSTHHLSYWITTGNAATAFPCTADGSNETYYERDETASPPTYSATTFVAPASGERTVETRQVNITLQGKTKRPAQQGATAAAKTLEVSVKVRNNRTREHL